MYSRSMKICNMLLYDTEPPWDWVQTVQCSATTQRQFLDHIQLWSPSLWENGISYAYQTLSVWKQIAKLHLLYMSYNTRYTLYQCKAAFLKTLTIILNFNNILEIGRDNTIIIIITIIIIFIITSILIINLLLSKLLLLLLLSLLLLYCLLLLI